jgi:hypothetical protein
MGDVNLSCVRRESWGVSESGRLMECPGPGPSEGEVH